jgi:hypothetical protein
MPFAESGNRHVDHAHTIIDTGGGRTATAAKGWMSLDEPLCPEPKSESNCNALFLLFFYARASSTLLTLLLTQTLP